MTTKKKNPKDLTLRNLRATKKRLVDAEAAIHDLKERVGNLEENIWKLTKATGHTDL